MDDRAALPDRGGRPAYPALGADVCPPAGAPRRHGDGHRDRKSTRLNSSHEWISYAVFCLKKKSVSQCFVVGQLFAELFQRSALESERSLQLLAGLWPVALEPPFFFE